MKRSEKAKNYNKALVFQTVTQLKDSFDFNGMKEAAKKHSRIADMINKDIKRQYDDYLQLTAGECTVCEVCALADDESCRFPDEAISSLEAYCMNVSTLAELCQMKYINGRVMPYAFIRLALASILEHSLIWARERLEEHKNIDLTRENVLSLFD